MKDLTHVFLFFLILFLSACSTSEIKEAKEEVKDAVTEEVLNVDASVTESVLGHHLQAFGENNIGEIMKDYTEESFIVTFDSTYTGKSAIRNFLAQVMKDFPAGQFSLDMDKMVIKNDVAYIVWRASTPTVEVPFASDTFVIRNGKIMSQTFAIIMNPVGSEA